MKTTYVLGTHASHDGSACLLRDGQIAYAIEKERITRTKHDGGDDNAAIRYCLDAEGITIEDVDLVVQNANFDMFARKHVRGRRQDRIVDGAKRVVTISHHLAHAYSAIGTAPFSEMAILVIDGCGNCYADCIDRETATIPEIPAHPDLQQVYFEKDSYYQYRDGVLRPVYKDFSPAAPRQRYPMYPLITMHSIGGAYSAVSQYVFGGMEDPGKLMGLAPYGRAEVFDFEMFTLSEGRVFVRYDWMEEFDRPAVSREMLNKDFQYYADIARWAQAEIERAVLYVVNHRYKLCPSENIAYAGGVALNAVANRRVATETPFKNLYVQPAASDNGLSIGCAYYGWLAVLGREKIAHDGRSNFGRTYRKQEISRALELYGELIDYTMKEDVVNPAADAISEGRVLGWFQGPSEFGPRALGHRSILASPTRQNLVSFINSRIKFREDFRPFAPSVVAEQASKFFEQDYDSPYMVLVAPVLSEWRSVLPAVIHRDGTARVQTVDRSMNPLYYRLLVAVEERLGVPVVLNTSLNRKGMPIVERPEEALDLFLETDLDLLVIDRWIVTKKQPASKLWLDPARVVETIRRAAPSASTSIRALELTVTNLSATWTLDLGQTSSVRRGKIPSPDVAIAMTLRGLQQAIFNPNDLKTLSESGHLTVLADPTDEMQEDRILRELSLLLSCAAIVTWPPSEH